MLLTQVLPFPPDSGPKVKTYNVLKYLSASHDVTLVSFVRGDQSAEVAALKRFCGAVHTVPMARDKWRDGLAMLRSLLTAQPWMMVRDDRAAMRELVDRLAREEHFDVAHADQLNMGQYALRVAGARKLLDLHNALWLLYKRLAETMPSGPRRWLLNRDWRLLKTYEGRLCGEFDAVMAVSEEDKIALQDAMGGRAKPIKVIPITVDGDEVAEVRRAPDAGNILHIGTMYWPPNIDGITWFVSEVLPLIRQRRPDVVFDCVGARPPQQLLELKQRDPRINVTGYVEDVQPFLQNAGVMIVPLRAGGGMRVKILNALAQGLPIVTTTLGCEGIAVEHGVSALIADTPAQLAESVLAVLADRELGDRLGRNARALFGQRYDYRVALRAMDELFESS